MRAVKPRCISVYVETSLGRSLAALQGNPVKLWVPQSPGKVQEEAIQWGLELIKGMAFTERDTERKKKIPVKTMVGDREGKFRAKDWERRKNINCLENADLKDV